MDARQMTFENGSFDVIVSSFAMHHMGGKAARERVLNEMVRVLKPGGKVLIYDVSGIIDDCAPVLQSQLSNVRSEGRLFKLLTCEKR
jgi:ubiquinone/menaquinone biosynthesis C-methylase UbiE